MDLCWVSSIILVMGLVMWDWWRKREQTTGDREGD
jgi:hypothetical protein